MTPAPYPSDTRAKGWRFEIDMEKVKGSDTWLRARTGLVKGALLLLWSEAWQQTPCGSLPNDDELVALLIDMPIATFNKHRGVLMRGWSLADDGRLYHETITTRVLAMLEKRAKDAKRTADRRVRAHESLESHADVTRYTTATTTRPDREFDTKHQAPEPKKKEKPPALPSLTVTELIAEGVSQEVAVEWLAHRHRKNARLTALAWKGFKAEVTRAGWTLDRAITKAISRGWTSFDPEWVKDAKGRNPDVERMTVQRTAAEEEAQRRAIDDRMTPEQFDAARKAKALAMSAIKRIA